MKKILIIKHVAAEGPGTFASFLKLKKIPFTQLEVFKDSGALLPGIDLALIGGVVILGGPMNVYETEKHPFLEVERDFIRRVVGREIPLLGVCLGAQLLAAALGGRVIKSPVKEVGWYPLELTGDAASDPLMDGFDASVPVFQWHEDMFEPPPRAVVLAQGNGIPQAFRAGARAWGFQFHVEVDAAMIDDWFKGSPRAAEMLTMYRSIEKDFRSRGERVYASFVAP